MQVILRLFFLSLIVLIFLFGSFYAVFANSDGSFPRRGSYTAWANANLFFNQGLQLSHGGNYVKAVENFQKAISTYGEDSNYYYNLGISLVHLNQSVMAEQAFKQAVELEPGFFHAWFNLGNQYLLQQNAEEAKRAFLEAEKCAMTETERQDLNNRLASLANIEVKKSAKTKKKKKRGSS